jgi:tRNA dimethylallyltransferase
LSAPIVVLGPTASGKSDVAMAFARMQPGVEIVAVDAMQVYRGMDVGTAKPTVDDRRRVPHHCLDLVDPWEEFTVADFVAAAGTAIADIERRGGTPVLVAGTGLYLRSLTDPMDLPGQWPAIRSLLERRAEREGARSLHDELVLVDPLAASRIEPDNARRLVRALEVVMGSGRPFSSFGPGLGHYAPTRFRMVGLRWARPALAERIEDRVERMFAAGLPDEVRRLLDAPSGLSRTARQALGYKELIDHFEGRCSMEEALEEIVVRTRQYSVRQERWFRRDPRITWVDIERDPVAAVLPVLEQP